MISHILGMLQVLPDPFPRFSYVEAIGSESYIGQPLPKPPNCPINCPHYSSAAVPFYATWSRNTTSLSTGTQKTSRPGPVWMRPLHGSQETSDVVHSSIVWVHHSGFFHVFCGLSLFLEFGAGTRFSLKNLVPPHLEKWSYLENFGPPSIFEQQS